MCRKIVREEHFIFVRLESKTRRAGPGHELIKLFSSSAQLRMKFSLLINMKMPTIVGIFIFISRENFMLSYVQQERICNSNLRLVNMETFMLS